jgi:Ni/Co efflux regulator RcnB
MNRFKMMLIGAALVAASSALASAQPVNDRHEGRYEDRDRDRGRDRDNDRRFDRDRDRDDHRNFRDRDDRRFVDRDDRRYFHDRDDYRYRVGERRFFNGYYWNWDGSRWCRNDRGVRIYFRF